MDSSARASVRGRTTYLRHADVVTDEPEGLLPRATARETLIAIDPADLRAKGTLRYTVLAAPGVAAEAAEWPGPFSIDQWDGRRWNHVGIVATRNELDTLIDGLLKGR